MSIYDFSRDVRGDGRRQRLLVDEDFSWSEPPSKRRGQAAVGERPRAARGAVAQSFPEPAVARVDAALHDDPPGSGRVEVRDLRDAGDIGTDRTRRQLIELDDSDVEELDVEDVYLDEDSGGLALPAEGRRTIVITGHGADRNLPARRHREAGLRVYERTSFKPDRIALWAFLLGLALLLGATTSSHAATLAQHLPH